MDISNLGSMYVDMYKDKASKSDARLDGQLKADYSKATDEELMDACKQFEAYFLEQVFKEMEKTIPRSEEGSSYTSMMTDYVKENLIQELASQSTETNSLGLAQMLYEQMKRNYDV